MGCPDRRRLPPAALRVRLTARHLPFRRYRLASACPPAAIPPAQGTIQGPATGVTWRIPACHHEPSANPRSNRGQGGSFTRRVKREARTPGPVARHPRRRRPARRRALRTLTTGRAPSRGRGAAFRRASAPGLLRPRSRARRRPGRARSLYIGRHLGLPAPRPWHRRVRAPGAPGPGQDEPCLRISFHTPSAGVATWNSLPISVFILPEVHRWSPANPCAPAGLSGRSASSRAHRRPLSFSRDTGPLVRQRRRAATGPGPHRPRRDPEIPAISPIPSPKRTARPPPAVTARAAAARQACTRPVAHTSYPGDNVRSQPTSTTLSSTNQSCFRRAPWALSVLARVSSGVTGPRAALTSGG